MSDKRRSSLPSFSKGTPSRLVKPDNAKVFQDQRDLAKAWREKNQAKAESIFSPRKNLVNYSQADLIVNESLKVQFEPTKDADDDSENNNFSVSSSATEVYQSQITASHNIFPRNNYTSQLKQVENLADISEDHSPFSSNESAIELERSAATPKKTNDQSAGFGSSASKSPFTTTKQSYESAEVVEEPVESQQQKIQQPNSPKQENEKTSNAVTRFVVKISKATGFDKITTNERVFLFSVLCVSPFLLYLLDSLFSHSVLTLHIAYHTLRQSPLTAVASFPNMVSSRIVSAFSAVLAGFEQAKSSVYQLDSKQWGSALLLSVLLSFAVDFNTKVIDRLVGRTVRAVSAQVASVRDKSARKGSEQLTRTPKDRQPLHTKIAAIVQQCLPLYVRTKVPLLLSYVVLVLAVSYGARYVLTHMFVAVVATVAPHTTTIYAVLATGLALYCASQYYLYRRRQEQVQQEVSVAVSVLVKKLLLGLHSQQPYPIEYLYEEVSDLLRHHKYVSPAPSAAATPAVAHSGTSFLGESVGLTPAQQHIAVAAPQSTFAKLTSFIFSPSKSSGGDGSNVHAVDVRAQVLEEAAQLSRSINLRGYSLKRLWKRVQGCVERDSRIQTVDVMVDGGNKKCWRVLSGKTNIVTSLFGGN